MPEQHRPEADQMVERNEVRMLPMPRFSSVENRVEVIFEGAAPVIREEE